MLNSIQADIREMLDLAKRIENFDATLAAANAAGQPIEPTQMLTIRASTASDGSSSYVASGMSKARQTLWLLWVETGLSRRRWIFNLATCYSGLNVVVK